MSFSGNPSPTVLAPNLGYSEIQPGFTRRWRNAVKGVRNGTGNARVLVLGDSTTAGAGAGTSGSFLYAGAAARCFPAQLPISELPYRFTSWCGCSKVNAQQSFASYDPRIVLSGSAGIWNNGVSLSGDLLTFSPGSTAGSITFSPGRPFDRVEVGYVSSAGNSSAVVSATDGTTTDTLGALVGNQATATRSSGTLSCGGSRTSVAITVNLDGGGVPVQWISTWSSGVKEVHVIQAGWAGGTLAQIATGSSAYASANQIAALNPDLVLIAGGTLNDASAATAAATWQATAQGLIDLIRGTAGADIAWMSSANAEGDSSNANNLTLNRTLRSLCQANNISLLDVHERHRPKSLYASSLYYDNRHPTYAGYSDWAAMAARFMRMIAEGEAD